MRRLVDNGLWELVEPLLPPESDKSRGGRPRVPDRAAHEGTIVYVLRSGMPCEPSAHRWKIFSPRISHYDIFIVHIYATVLFVLAACRQCTTEIAQERS